MFAVHALAAQAVEPSNVTWTAALLAWILAVPLFLITRYVDTVAHEGGHALMGLLLLRTVRSIRFSRGGGGSTDVDQPGWPFSILIGLTGYLGSSIFGLMAAWLLIRGETMMVLWGSMAFLAIMLFAVRGVLGFLLVPTLLVVLYQVATKAEPPAQTLFAHVWTWFLLITAVQNMIIFMEQQLHRHPGSDTAFLGRQTLLPSELWGVVLLLATTAALVWGGAMLLRLG